MRFPFLRSQSTPTSSSEPSPPDSSQQQEEEYTPQLVTEDERARAWEQFRQEMDARAAEGPEALAEFFETLAAAIRLLSMPPEAIAALMLSPWLQTEQQQMQTQQQPQPSPESTPEPTPQEPQQEVKTESVREKLLSPRSASSRARGKSLRDIIGIS